MEDLSELQRLERQVSCSLFASAHRRRRRYFASLLLMAYSMLKTHAYMEVQLICKAINSKPSPFLRKDKQINGTPRLFMHTHNQISFKPQLCTSIISNLCFYVPLPLRCKRVDCLMLTCFLPSPPQTQPQTHIELRAVNKLHAHRAIRRTVIVCNRFGLTHRLVLGSAYGCK